MADALDAIWGDVLKTEAIHGEIRTEATDLGIDPALALSLAHQESRFDPMATSPTGVQGLFQVTQATGQQYGQPPAQRTNRAYSMHAGLSYLKDLLTESHGNVEQALTRYNGGSDPRFAANVLSHYPLHAARQPAAEDPIDALAREIGLTQPALPAGGAGPRPPAAAQTPPAGEYTRPDSPPRPAGEAAPAIPVSPPGGAVGPGTQAQGTPPPAPGEQSEHWWPMDTQVFPNQDPTQPALLAPPGYQAPIDIAKPSEGNAPEDPQRVPEAQWDELLGRQQGLGDWARQGTALALQYGGTVAGGALGGLTSPVTGPVGALAGAAAGSYGARRFNVAMGLEDEGAIGDVVSIAAPLAPLALRGAKWVVAHSRAGRALTEAETATVAQSKEAYRRWAQADIARENAAGKAQTTYETTVAQRTAKYAAQVQAAEDKATAATLARERAYQAKGQAASAAEDAAELETQRAYKQAIQDYETATQAHTDAVQRVEQLPSRYLPAMPPRTTADIRRDLAALDDPGTARPILERLGVRTPQEASAALMAEAETATTPVRAAGDPMAASYRTRQPTAEAPGVELQKFIREKGGMTLTDEELAGEFRGVISRRETGTTGLQNNRRGMSVQQMAEAAQERGYIKTADKEALLEGLRTSVQGTPVYGSDYLPPSPTSTAPTGLRLPPSTQAQRTSQVLYQRLDEVAGSAPVDLSPVREVASVLQERLGQAMPSMQPTRLQRILGDLESMGDKGNVAQVHQALKDLGPLTRATDSQTRGMAKQLYMGFQNALDQSAMEIPETGGARQLLGQAKQAWRQEQAVSELQRLLTRGGTVLKYDAQGQLTMNPQALLNQTERLIARDPFFAGSFTPEDLASLRHDLRSFVGTPAMPKSAPAAPEPMQRKALGPPPAPVQPRPVPPPQMPQAPPGYTRYPFQGPPAVEPKLGGLLPSNPLYKGMAGAAGVGGLLSGGIPSKVAMTLGGIDVAEYLLSKALLTPALRPVLLRAMTPNGKLDPKVLATLATALQIPWVSGQGQKVDNTYPGQ